MTKAQPGPTVNHMAKQSISQLDSTFSALSDPTRRAILARLAQGDATVSQLAAPFDMSLPAISKHLRVLEDAGLIQRHREGRIHRMVLVADPLRDAAQWLAVYQSFWEDSFDALANLLDEDSSA